MSVKLTNFVQIAINHAIKINANATRDTAVVIHYKADATSVSYKSLTEAPSFSGETAYLAGIQDYIEAFFRNAGRKLYVVTVNSIDITTPATSVVLTELRNLPILLSVLMLAQLWPTLKTAQKLLACSQPELLLLLVQQMQLMFLAGISLAFTKTREPILLLFT